MSKKTIVIIGATGNRGSAFAKSLAKENYRLLLFAHEAKKLNSLAEEIRKQTQSADIDCMGCAADASWEADIIIAIIPPDEEKETAGKIELFANRKIVISICDSLDEKIYRLSDAITATKELQQLLPGAKVAKLFNIPFDFNFPQPAIGGKKTPILIGGSDEEALQAAEEILKMTGIDHAERINQHINKQHEKII